MDCSLFAWIASEDRESLTAGDMRLGWYRAREAARAYASFDVRTCEGTNDIGAAVDRIEAGGTRVWERLQELPAVEPEIVLWFDRNDSQEVHFRGEWLSSNKRPFRISAQFTQEGRSNENNTPTSQAVTIEWFADSAIIDSETLFGDARERQPDLESVMYRALADGATRVQIALLSGEGRGGAILPSGLMATLMTASIGLSICAL